MIGYHTEYPGDDRQAIDIHPLVIGSLVVKSFDVNLVLENKMISDQHTE